ncbi:hypothetical protein FWF74_04140 [Candidatus Saccharibacteria bacterium]|nr:hypothetical protein [Candidatus Saccharibacteria bacterium]MCL1962753.1 hypothetical protein [Candidatus Saccharibacteria bacterium]
MLEVYSKYLQQFNYDDATINKSYIKIPYGVDGRKIMTYENQGKNIRTARHLFSVPFSGVGGYESVMYSAEEMRGHHQLKRDLLSSGDSRCWFGLRRGSH